MKRLLVILILIPSLAFGAITRVQSKASNTGNATANPLTITLDSNATIGNTLIVAVGMSSAQTLRTVVFGSNSSMYLAQAFDLTGGIYAQIYYVRVQEVSNSIVITLSANATVAAVAVEYNGTLIAQDIPPLIANGTGTSNATGTTATTNYANELLVAAMASRGQFATEQTAWLTSITNSFSSVAQTSTNINTSNVDRAVAFLERVVTSTGTFSTAGTQGNVRFANVIATFTDNPTPTPTSTATPTATATASFTPCAPTPANTPTATPTNTPTPTPTPTVTPTPIPKAFTFPG